jgi:ketosteroid isomerase-like protein
VSAAKPELVSRFFERFGAGDVAAALALATDDLRLDWRNSNAPWGGGVATGHDQATAAYRSFAAAWEEIGGVRWDVVRMRPATGGRLVVETRISGRGPRTDLPMDAIGAWLVSGREGRVSEAVMY